MDIHEHQAKELLQSYGIPAPAGRVVFSKQEAIDAAQEIGGSMWVVKAQIHAGGRGKGGGVKLVRSLEEVGNEFERMWKMQLVTPQTGPAGRLVQRIYIAEATDIAKEHYLSVLVDRASSRVSFVASTEGGVDIEEVAEKTPEKIFTMAVDPVTGVSAFHGRKIAAALQLTGSAAKQCADIVFRIYKMAKEKDASLLEVNPLVLTEQGDITCLDAKMSFDDNALYRHPDVLEMRDLNEEDAMEIKASEYDLSYVKLDGNIGCMVNGAGLAMATMDIIKHYGAEPANFLDVGGGATKEKVAAAFRIILSDASVKGVLVNIFGGIMRCDVIAEGVLAAAAEVGLKIPLVVRLEGTNVEKGKAVLAASDLTIISADDLADAAQKVVQAVAA